MSAWQQHRWEDNDWGQHTESWWEENSNRQSAWDDTREKPQQDRFRNVTTLGCFGKHPMNLEDRKDLLLGVVTKLVPNNHLSQMSVANWGADTTMAAFSLLTNCGPMTPIRWLKGPNVEKYCLPTAVQIMANAAQSFFAGEPSKFEEMVDFIVASSWKDQEAIVAKAMENGYDPNETLDPFAKRFRVDSRVGASGSSSSARPNPLTDPGMPRTLLRTNTEDAIEEEKKDWRGGGHC